MSDHWYKSDGTPCHKVPNAAESKKQKKDIFRDTNLRDARKLNLYPSVTGILPTPEWVHRWRLSQYLAAVRREEGKGLLEPPKHYLSRVRKSANTEMNKAPNLGTKVHGMIEALVLGHVQKWQPGSPEDACIGSFQMWYNENVKDVIATESTFCSPKWGFGGTVDLQHRNIGKALCITDYKTKKTVEGTKIKQELNQKRQLVAYALGMGKIPYHTEHGVPRLIKELFGDCPILGNLYLSTTEPGRWEYITVPPEKIPELILDVRNCVRLWQRENNFHPNTQNAREAAER